MTHTNLAFVAVLLMAGPARGPQPSDTDWSWLSDHRQAAFEALMPMAAGASAYVTYRSYRDLYQDVPEGYFSIRGRPTVVSLEATVVVPRGRSVQQQLLEMHMGEPEAALTDLLPRVQLERTELQDDACPALPRQLTAFSKRRFTLPLRDLIILHPTVHAFNIEFGGGTVEASIEDDDHPLAQWAVETLAALRRCGARR